MSSLVAYGSSGEESDGDSGEEVSPAVIVAAPAIKKSKGLGGGLSLPTPKNTPVDKIEDNEEPVAKKTGAKSIFSSLPEPKRDVLADLVLEETEEPVPLNKNGTTIKQKVKISVPSLSQFVNDEEDAPKPKKQKLAPKGSGLLAVLPEPINTLMSNKAFMPHVLTKKPAAPAPKKAVQPKAPAKKAALVTNYSDSEGESGDEFTPSTSSSGIDFFSLSTSHVAPAPVNVNLDEFLPVAGPSRPEKIPEVTYAQVEDQDEEQEEVETEEMELSDEAIRKLCGKRKEEIGSMIDIQGEAVYKDAKEWMLRNLTEEPEKDYSHRDSQPNNTMKRKHQITYLAFQAKERETELKNQWASNRQSKKQTQAKYGF